MKMINIVVLTLLLCTTCTSKSKDTDEEITSLFASIKEYIDNEDIYIRDELGPMQSLAYFKELEEDILDETSDFLTPKDIGYIKEQINKIQRIKKCKYWSQTDIDTGLTIINVDHISKFHNTFSESWWQEYNNEFKHDNITIFSYPVFNTEHNLAFITYRNLSSIIGNGSLFEKWIFRKDEKGNWKYLGGGLSY